MKTTPTSKFVLTNLWWPQEMYRSSSRIVLLYKSLIEGDSESKMYHVNLPSKKHEEIICDFFHSQTFVPDVINGNFL